MRDRARELWRQIDGKVACFGAGGIPSRGVGKFVKEQDENVRIVAVEPENHSVLPGRENRRQHHNHPARSRRAILQHGADVKKNRNKPDAHKKG